MPSSTSRCSAGYDIAGYTLCSFGGAGGQHACLVADRLGINTVFLHPWPACCRPMASASPTSGCSAKRPGTAAGTDLEATLQAEWAIFEAEALEGWPASRVDAGSPCSPGRICAIRAPTPRWRCRPARRPRWTAFERRIASASASSLAGRGLIVEAVEVEAIGVGETAEDPRLPLAAGGASPLRRSDVVGRGPSRNAAL